MTMFIKFLKWFIKTAKLPGDRDGGGEGTGYNN